MNLLPCAEAWLAPLDEGLRDFYKPYLVDFLAEVEDNVPG